MTDTLTCDDCGEAVTLDRNSVRALLGTCDCDEKLVSAKVATIIPEEWSA